MLIKDETMSQDEAFSNTDVRNTFEFDEEESSESQTETQETHEHEEAPSSAKTDEDVSEQRVPYSRFKKMRDEAEQANQRFEDYKNEMDARLAAIESRKSGNDDVEVPADWLELYGDSDASKRAYKLQLKREEEIEIRAIQRAKEEILQSQTYEETRLQENEGIIEDELADLQAERGVTLSTKQQEELLAIVDEFSPVGKDGKYITVFPFDKAYEIYALRKQQLTRKTHNARTEVARLSSDTSDGESDDSSGAGFNRGWDGWRNQL